MRNIILVIGLIILIIGCVSAVNYINVKSNGFRIDNDEYCKEFISPSGAKCIWCKSFNAGGLACWGDSE